MHPKDAAGIANSVDLDQTAWSSLIWVCTVCPDLSVIKLRIITVLLDICRMEYFEILIKSYIGGYHIYSDKRQVGISFRK